MKKLKLMTVVGTRPEIIRLSETIKKADRFFEQVFVHTGQNYDPRLGEIFFDDLELRRPDVRLEAAGADLGETLGNIIARSYAAMVRRRPDALLVLGDTNSALSALAAKRLKIPVFHMEAGNRCFDENLPEEINRRIVDHVADVNLAYTEHARRYLLAEGVRKEHVYVTGSPMAEVLHANRAKIEASAAVEELGLEKGRYILLSAHREENVDHPGRFASLVKAVNSMAETYRAPVIFSVHPRSGKIMRERGTVLHELIREMPPFPFTDYSRLMRDALCVVSDSGTLPEEAALCGFPAVSLRTSTERPEALDKGRFVIGGITPASLLRAVAMATALAGERGSAVPDYEAADVSSRVVRIILGYADIVNSTVWRKAVE
ncbi:MAG: UDP-N-acetylglucosamine 2-epimerase (non-hydrolyzing) [Planctomycetota bacterium]|jgi:UDP-N-acetylglucosamine 2-epimerase (non-hydrolysing)|nr:UDP-N-acetylglucosamine 2-epimerase (non-hydrolyzing) [Planctomycetota bacterium]